MSDSARKAVVDEWGAWTLVDEKAEKRPKDDFYQQYPNRDVPRDKFPATAWQLDTNYLAKFLPEALALVERAQTAILKEYGQKSTSEMFRTYIIDDDRSNYNTTVPYDQRGGWMVQSSWNGLKRRLLHAILTEDSFVFGMGGHSAAAGHG